MILSIYCDGSSHAKSGKPGGWAFFAVLDGVCIGQGAGAEAETSNNRMELTAAIKGMEWALRYTQGMKDILTEVVSDSQYALGMANGSYQPTKNEDLVAQIRTLYDQFMWRTRWVPGHEGDRWNEECDRAAGKAKKALVAELKARAVEEGREKYRQQLEEADQSDPPTHQ